MGITCQYMMVNKKVLKKLIKLNPEDLFEMLEELNDEDENEVCDIDKLWDGIHFLLTGVSACTPLIGNKLSEAIIGVSLLNQNEESDFISYTKNIELRKIISSLKSVDIENLRLNFDLSKFRKADIYPEIWRDDEKDSLFNELVQGYKDLLNFYNKALEKNKNVVISIY